MHDLTPFCSDNNEDSERYALRTPWVTTGWQYATNGRVCVRQPSIAPATDDGSRRPKVGVLFERFPECTEDWPHHDGTLTDQKCCTCRGTGQVDCECPTCETWHQAPCQDCFEGFAPAAKVLIIAGRKIQGKYCLKIQALGPVLYCAEGEPDRPLAFQCGELQGLVMPLVTDG